MKKRYLSVIMAAFLAASALAGCGGDSTSSTGGDTANTGTESSASAEGSGEKKTITAISFERGQCAASEGTMEDNRWTQWIDENSPVNVDWVPIPRTESTAKTNALFASGSAPDLVWEFNKGFMNGLIDQGVLQPIDDYIEQYSTSYKTYLENHPELKPYVTSDSDGLMYAFTSARTPLAVANHGMWIRQDWLDNLGLSTPTTMEELDNVVRKFTTDDPDGNGQNDTFGVGFNYNFKGIMKALYGGYEMMVVDDKLVDWNTTDGYKDFLTQVKAWYTDGVIDPEYITDTNYERQRQLIVTGKSGTYFAGWDQANEWRELKQNVPEAELVPLESVETSYGKFGCYQEPPANMIVCMNKDASDPEACVQFIDWLIDGNWMTLRYGEEGVHYNLVDGIPQTIDADKNAIEVTYAKEYALVANDVIEDIDKYMTISAAEDELSQAYAPIRALALETQMKNTYRRDIPALPSTDLNVKYNSEFNASFAELEDRCITDPSYSVEQCLADMDALRDSLGFDEVMAEYQAWYDENKENLVME
ncbi:MAG: extracellular solute-binding protein [Candidatus Merdivicinus sp.]|jgi:putative aldouronate transport system substrate-binding protein